MNYFLTMTYDLIVHFAEDYGGDEPRLEFAFIGGSTHPEVQVLDTGQLATDYHPHGGNVRVLDDPTADDTSSPWTLATRGIMIPITPTDEAPFLGFAVRAIENDNSRDSDRRRDQRRLKQRLEEGLESAFLTSTPTATDIWVLANSLPLIDNFGDDDDRIGVSARAYPTLGRGLQGSLERR